MSKSKKQAARSQQGGFTLIELATVIGVVIILAVLVLPNLRGKRGAVELESAASQMAALLREAQSRAIAKASSTTLFGVRFDNSTTTGPFYALYTDPYGTSTVLTRALFPPSLRYATSSIALGSYREITFAALTGLPSTSTAITIEQTGNSSASGTVTVSAAGVINF